MKTEINNNEDFSYLKWRILIICSLGLFIDGVEACIEVIDCMSVMDLSSK